MLSMTDYIERDVIQESEVEEPISEQQIMESFMALQVSFAQLECMCEYQTIIEYCGNEIPHPTLYQEGNFADTINDWFDNLYEWLAGIVRGMMQACNRSTLRQVISAIERDKREDYKFPNDFLETSIDIEMNLAQIDSLAEVLNDIKDGGLDDEKTKQLIDDKLTALAGKFNKNTWLTGIIVPASFSQEKYDRFVAGKRVRLTNKDELVEELKKLYDLNIPSTGKKLLRKLKFDKKETKQNGKINKDINRKVRKAANNIAMLYDNKFNTFIEKLKKFCKDNEISTKDLPSSGKKEYSAKWASRTFRDQTDPVSSLTPVIRNNKS